MIDHGLIKEPHAPTVEEAEAKGYKVVCTDDFNEAVKAHDHGLLGVMPWTPPQICEDEPNCSHNHMLD